MTMKLRCLLLGHAWSRHLAIALWISGLLGENFNRVCVRCGRRGKGASCDSDLSPPLLAPAPPTSKKEKRSVA